MVWDLDTYCLRGYRLFYTTFSKIQSQGSNNKDFSHSKKSKSKDPKPVPPRNNAAAELAEKEDKKHKKKRFRKQRREHTGQQKEQTPATGVNKVILKKKLKVRCFNCDKKDHYANNCTKPQKN